MMPKRQTLIRTLLRLLGCMLAGALCMLAFTVSPTGYVGISDPPLAALSPGWLLYALLLGGLFWLATGTRAARPTVGIALWGLLFGVANYFATTLFAYDTWAFLCTGRAWLGAAWRILLQGMAMAAVFAVVCGWLEGAPLGHNAPRALHDLLAKRRRTLALHFPRMARTMRRHPTLAAMGFLLLCWSPFLVAFFPGTIIWDMGEMLGQLYGLREMSTWHPVFTTWLFGACVWLGRLLAGDNLGAFLFTLLQTITLAYALAESVRFLHRLGLPVVWRLLALAFFGLSPIFGSFAQAVGKDTLYTAALLLFALRAAEGLHFGALNGKRLWGLGAWALLACLLRTNGLYVVLGTAAVLLPFWLGRRGLRPACGALLAALALAFGFNGLLLPALHIKDATASGIYSVLFQQSARTLRDHAATVTPAEMAEIDRVLDAQALPALYEANISDPVKYTFRQYGQGRQAETEALARYRQTWLAMLQKYPLTYLEAFIAGGSGYYAFTPKIDAARTFNYQGGIRFVFETYALGDDPRYLHTTQPAALAGVRTLLAAWARGWRRVPLLELLLFCPTYTWLLAAACHALLRRRRWRDAAAFVPALLSLGVCLLSPVNDYFRYFLPVVAMCPMLLGLARAGQQTP